ncbi:hypothetical protein BSZ39_01280 [Bowdeniella nasicola]|uniref:Clp R domain-containing protein n=1 Tax=Bowdeniella nasicola TaxID=208480 RepID=A0A1Q5Q531_9ACTO|nr:Clp protease N-terminal domain-containing protein [Bowdeniella nasicola]OKL54937.1 hypothetical protein BSZ39_01280 [Bowdeniella nasicola]
MTKNTTALAAVHTLSLAAIEEASRRGEHAVGVEHLFLALVLNGQAAGQTLRSFGITLELARAAVDAQHADQLSLLGIHTQMPAPGPVTIHKTSGYEWSPGALEVIKRAGKGEARGATPPTCSANCWWSQVA